MPDDSLDREVTRLEGFSDAVFGFAITLLVVSLEVPATYDDLVAAFRGLPVFAATFALLLLIWHEHHRFFRKFAMQDGLTIWLNGGLLFVVMVYIYPLKFLFGMIVTPGGMSSSIHRQMIRPDQIPSLMTMYGAGFVSIFVLLGLMYLHAARAAGRTAEERVQALLGVGQCGVYVGTGMLSIAIAVIGNGPFASTFAGFAYALIGPFQWLYGRSTARYRITPSPGAAISKP